MQLFLDKDDITILSELGLTNNQIKIYISLLKLGTAAKAVNIFQVSGVARQDVYRVLLELQQIGIVEKIISKPNKFRAVQPKKTVSILVENKMQNINVLNYKAKIFADKAINRYFDTDQSNEKDMFRLITKKQAIIREIKELIEKTQVTFCSIAPRREFLSCLTILSESLNSIKNRGVKVRWVTQIPDKDDLTKIYDILTENNQIRVKCIPNAITAKFAMSDNREISLAVFEEGNFGEAPALLTNSSAILSLGKKLL